VDSQNSGLYSQFEWGKIIQCSDAASRGNLLLLHGFLTAPHRLGKKLCARCKLAQTHRIYMKFMLRDGWECQFLEEDLKTDIRKRVIFRDPQKIREAAERGHSLTDADSRLSLDNDIKIGWGGIWLQLTEDQYQALRRGEKWSTCTMASRS